MRSLRYTDHRSAEPDTLVVRNGYDEREWLIEDAPETYCLTDYYWTYPLVSRPLLE